MSPDQDDWDLLDVPVLGHLGVVIVDGIEGSLIFQTGARRFISIGLVLMLL